MLQKGKEESLHALFDMDTSDKVKGVDHYNHLQVSILIIQKDAIIEQYNNIVHQSWNIFYSL